MASSAKKDNSHFSFLTYIINILSAMSLGLFSSLIVGLILKTFGEQFNVPVLIEYGKFAMSMLGPTIGAAIAYSLQAPPLVLFSSVAVGYAGNQLGGPVGALISAAVCSEIGRLVSRKTKLDIVVTPAVTLVSGMAAAQYVGPWVNTMMTELGLIVMRATELHPAMMGSAVSTIMGMVLTLPISSAALAVSLNLGGLAAGAACVGCSTQMIGFAVASYRENGATGFISQGLGTSMLQIPNIVRNPMIWVPPTLASAILGPLSTLVFKLENIPSGAGMGTSGLVGQFGTIAAMGSSGDVFMKIALMHFILPAVTTLAISEGMRKLGFINPGDMELNNG